MYIHTNTFYVCVCTHTQTHWKNNLTHSQIAPFKITLWSGHCSFGHQWFSLYCSWRESASGSYEVTFLFNIDVPDSSDNLV